MLKDFREFVMRGNLVDMAIGFTVGAAFTTVAKSLVNDILMPPVGLVTGGSDFADFFVVLKEGAGAPEPYLTLADAQEAGAVTLNYGIFVNNILALLIVALAIYAIIRVMNRIRDRLDEATPAEADAEPAREKKCGFCKEVVDAEAVRCPHCTSHLEEPALDA